MPKVIIAGSRGFDDYRNLEYFCDVVLMNEENITIVSGTANGADKLGEKYTINRKYKIDKFPANWDKYGKSAGYIRNSDMADYSDILIAFWDNKSKGTKHMIDLANKKNLKVVTYEY